MSENDTKTFDDNDGPLAGDALLQAVRQLDAKVQALDEKVDARLRDTAPMWEVVVSRLDIIIAGQESHASRLDSIEGHLDSIEGHLDAIEAEQRKQGTRLDAVDARLDAIESRLDAIEVKLERFDAIDRELRHLGRRIERTIAELSGDFVKFRVDQHDLEDRVEKLEKTPA